VGVQFEAFTEDLKSLALGRGFIRFSTVSQFTEFIEFVEIVGFVEVIETIESGDE
jgi:hypothetical protein